MYVIVYNSLGSSRSTVVRLPVSSDSAYNVSRMGGEEQEAAILRSIPSNSTGGDGADHVLLFDTGLLPPVGASVFRITMVKEQLEAPIIASPHFPRASSVQSRDLTSSNGDQGDVEVSNGLVTARFDR